jgi:hypothetical protein
VDFCEDIRNAIEAGDANQRQIQQGFTPRDIANQQDTLFGRLQMSVMTARGGQLELPTPEEYQQWWLERVRKPSME